jgi:hypothetical protein
MVKFPYREEGNPPVLRPTVDVQLNCAPNGEWTTRALIDSGSPLTIFDRGVAEALCINIGSFGADGLVKLKALPPGSAGDLSRRLINGPLD